MALSWVLSLNSCLMSNLCDSIVLPCSTISMVMIEYATRNSTVSTGSKVFFRFLVVVLFSLKEYPAFG